MRIAIVNWSNRKVGGAETYIECVAGGLCAAGHEAALFCEIETSEKRVQLQMPSGAPCWSASRLGAGRALDELRSWRPDVIYGHSLLDPRTEAATLRAAPAVFFAHGYYGTCIGGVKTFKYPTARPCTRRFGWPCLIHFYPHRCGGLSPLTMRTEFRRQSRRLQLLRSYQAILTASEHMRREYLNHGFSPDAVKVVPLPVNADPGLNGSADARRIDPLPTSQPCRLLFAGRMDPLKGGGVLLDALPRVRNLVGRLLHVTFAGEGPQRVKWEEKARRIQAHDPDLKIAFTGWLDRAALGRLYAEADLLVVPSVWPEPFGLVGPEAGLHGLPAAAFNVGGISEWLHDGVNGYLAPGDPPSAEGLAHAIVKCLAEPAQYARLRSGALETAKRFSLANHISQLIPMLESAAGHGLSVVSRQQQCARA